MKSTQITSYQTLDNRPYLRLIKVMLAAVVLITLAFSSYYIWDRYVHLGDMSPVELGINHELQIVEQNPNDPAARLTLAQTYIEAGNYPEAIRHAEKVLRAYPDSAGALILLGVAYSEMGNAQEAVNYLEQFAAIRRQSNDPSLDKVLEAGLYYLGSNYVALKQPEKAIAVLKEAQGIDTTDADVLVLLGQAYNQTGQYTQAIASFKETIRFVPDYVEAYQGLAQSYQALDMPPYAAYAQGMEAYSNRDYARALELLQQSSVDLADQAVVYLGLALTYEQMGNLQAAQENAKRTLELDADNFTASNILSRLQNGSTK